VKKKEWLLFTKRSERKKDCAGEASRNLLDQDRMVFSGFLHFVTVINISDISCLNNEIKAIYLCIYYR
jgi:hypothetical protein